MTHTQINKMKTQLIRLLIDHLRNRYITLLSYRCLKHYFCLDIDEANDDMRLPMAT